ncbi:hypothetical protein WBG78_16735 [Chryseolinea sp. T2]|uniref:hypothetical protein n=1 Tax=Chryseolinea sp. T2 TaxID=3129255 RepID=UPI003077DBF1
MRVVGEIPHASCKITILAWNNRYLLKLEQGLLEQTYKINEYDLAGEQDLKTLVDESFVQNALKLFEQMSDNLHQAMDRL